METRAMLTVQKSVLDFLAKKLEYTPGSHQADHQRLVGSLHRHVLAIIYAGDSSHENPEGIQFPLRPCRDPGTSRVGTVWEFYPDPGMLAFEGENRPIDI